MIIKEIEASKGLQPKIRNAVAYARVSTESAEQENSLYAQTEYWERKIKINAELRFCGVYADHGISGKNAKNRKQFNEMIRQAKLKKIDIIFTKSISRFARNVVETLEIVRDLRSIGIEVYFEKENISTLDATSELMLTILSSISEQELNSMSDNVRVSARHRYSMGSVELNKKILGYTFDENNKLVIVPKQAEIVRLIFDLALKGYGVSRIAKELEVRGYKTVNGNTRWSHTTLNTMLKNEKYAGNDLLQKSIYERGKRRINNGEVEQYFIENSHEAIVSQDVFDKVQELRIQRTVPRSAIYAGGRPFEFTSIIECGQCGGKYSRKTIDKGKKTEKYKWQCKIYDTYGIEACASHAIKEEVLKEKFIECFNDLVVAPKLENNISPQKQRLTRLIAEEQELNKLFVKGYISKSQFEEESSTIIGKIKELESQIKQTNSQSSFNICESKITEYNEELVRKYVEKVTVKDWTVTFFFINGFISRRTYTNGKCGNKRKN